MAKVRPGGRFQLKTTEYHTPPPPWGRDDLLRLHERLGGTFPLATTPRDTSTPRREPIWYNLADGIRAGDDACVELGVRFLEAQFVNSHSGYARTRIARALRHAPLRGDQRRRLSDHFWSLLTRGDRFLEFTEYLRLWRVIADGRDRERVRAFVEAHPSEPSRFRQRLARVADDT